MVITLQSASIIRKNNEPGALKAMIEWEFVLGFWRFLPSFLLAVCVPVAIMAAIVLYLLRNWWTR
jgi:hypothetical protein